MNSSDLADHSATALAALFRRRECSPVDAVNAVLDRIESSGDPANAMVTVVGDQARAEARRIERMLIAAPERATALCGVPVTVKDLTATRGIRTARGSVRHRHSVPDHDAVGVERLRAAGAIIVGKTNTSEDGWKAESGNLLFGPTTNPWRSDVTAGGSSGGAAAGVAMGFGPIGTGTDGAGSIRIPASFCGVVGLKPSFGLVPYHPASAELLSHLGPVTRTVGDAAAVLDVLAGADERDPYSWGDRPFHFARETEIPPPPLRIAVIASIDGYPVDPEIAAALDGFLDLLGGLGHEPHERTLDAGGYEAVEVILAAHAAADHRESGAAPDAPLDTGLARVVERGLSLTAADLALAETRRAAVAADARRALAGLDAAVMPSVAVLPFEPGADGPPGTTADPRTRLAWASFSYPWNVTGYPAISVPAGFSRGGLPIGMQIVGRWRQDTTVLRLARQVELARPWAHIYHRLRHPAPATTPGERIACDPALSAGDAATERIFP